MFGLQIIIDGIWQAGKQGLYYPPEWKGKLSVDDGYRVQLGLLKYHEREGQQQVGWKVGLTAPAIREQIGFHEPVFGYLLSGGAKPSASTFRMAELIAPSFETEICLTLSERLQGPGVTAAQARRAIGAAAPAFELVERRGDFAADFPLALADNVQQKYFVTGAAMQLPPDLSLPAVSVEVAVNGKPRDRATGAEVMGDPAASVAWLANRLAAFGQALEAGMQVMSGSLVRQYALAAGDRIEARFDPLGTVTAAFT
jgi:2-keto-4-pentenoate hydratase